MNRHSSLAGIVIGMTACVVLALMARNVIDHVTLYDELLHLLSARGLLVTGQPVIADGLYARAQLFTRFVALSLQLFGSTPVASRLPALAFAMALAVLLSVWVTKRAGALGGLGAVAVLCLLPTTIELAVFARFYTMHALVITALAIVVYEAAEPQRSLRYRLISGVAALALIAIGLHLQETTIIAVGAIGAGIAAILIRDHWAHVAELWRRYPVPLAAGIIVAIVAGAAAAWFLGLIDRLSEAPLWAMHAAHRPAFYLVAFADSTPLLWPLFPVIAVIAFRVQPRLTLFCLIALTITVIMHSIAAQKSVRYLYYALPLLCVVWGAGVAGIFRLLQSRDARSAGTRNSTIAVVAVLIAVTLLLSLEGQRAVKLVLGRLAPIKALGYAVEADWSSAIPTLVPRVAAAARILTSNSMKSIYFLGRYDYELNASIVGETDSEQEFGRDERTGGKAIGTLESTRKVLDMPGRTLVVLEQETMNLESGVPAASVAEISSRCAPVTVPKEAEISVWECTHS